MTIVASILCIAIVAALHVTVVQKNPKLTNRVCITGANIILSLAFVVLLYAINTVQDEAKLVELSRNILKFARPNASEDIAKEVIRLAEENE